METGTAQTSHMKCSAHETARELQRAVRNGHTATVHSIVKRKAADVNMLCPNELPQASAIQDHTLRVFVMEPPLVTATRLGYIPMVKLLLQDGADANMQSHFCTIASPRRGTALHFAVMDESVELVNLLLENGASVHAKDSDGETALHKAAKCYCVCNVGIGGHASSKQFAREHEKQRKITELLCRSSSGVDVKNNDGATPLHIATFTSGCPVKSEIIFKAAGAYVEALNDNLPPFFRRGRGTALHVACYQNNAGMASFLIKNGANLNVIDLYGETPLLRNVRCVRHSAVAAMLIIHGADVNLTDVWGHPLLRVCLDRTDRDLLCRLLVFAGYKVTQTYDRSYYKENALLYEFVAKTQRNAHRLDDLARIKIRQHLSRIVGYKSIAKPIMEMDSLPKLLRDFLFFKDITYDRRRLLNLM